MTQLIPYEEKVEEDSTLIEDLPWHFRNMKVLTPSKEIISSYTIEDEREILLFEKSLKKGWWAILTSPSVDPIERVSRVLVVLTLAALLVTAILVNT